MVRKNLSKSCCVDQDLRNPRFYDRGFYNTGIQPTALDLGNGGSDKFGLFSPTLRARQGQNIDQRTFDAPINALPVAIAGTFKTPGLRNVELTGPYFHKGGYLFLEEVLEVYARGADFRNENSTCSTKAYPEFLIARSLARWHSCTRRIPTFADRRTRPQPRGAIRSPRTAAAGRYSIHQRFHRS